MVALQGGRHVATGLGVLDEAAQQGLGTGAAAAGQAHGLFDDHEATGQQAQAGHTGGVGFQLLAHAGGHLMVA